MATALFLLDTALDAAMLLIAARLDGRWIRLHRLLLGALLGAGGARIIQMLGLSHGKAAVLWMPLSYLMMLAALGKRALLRPVRCICLLLCASGLMGGTLTALHGATGSLLSAYVLGAVLMTAMTASLLRSRRAAADVHSVWLTCCWRGKRVRFEAMIDSGNTLRDYLTHRPVIVMPKDTGRRLFELENAPLRPIFADTAGGRQMMDVFVPDEIVLHANGKDKKVLAAVALSDALSKEAPVLAPASLLHGEAE